MSRSVHNLLELFIVLDGAKRRRKWRRQALISTRYPNYLKEQMGLDFELVDYQLIQLVKGADADDSLGLLYSLESFEVKPLVQTVNETDSMSLTYELTDFDVQLLVKKVDDEDFIFYNLFFGLVG